MVSAVAVVRGDSDVKGTIRFSQEAEADPVTVDYDITGNTPSALRGFHIHNFGDVTNGCVSAGPHFNPNGVSHGDRAGTKETRHVGDFGNIQTDDKGVAKGSFTDKLVTLFGANSIVGRSVVVHAGQDDLGKGVGAAAEESKKTGNAGGRNACGVIGFSN